MNIHSEVHATLAHAEQLRERIARISGKLATIKHEFKTKGYFSATFLAQLQALEKQSEEGTEEAVHLQGSVPIR